MTEADKTAIVTELLALQFKDKLVQLQLKEKEVEFKDQVIQDKDKFIQGDEKLIQAKEDIIQAKEDIIQAKDVIIQAKVDYIKQIMAERDYLNGTLYARYIIERYEERLNAFKMVHGKQKLISRKEKWQTHLGTNSEILEELKKCDGSVEWGADHAVDAYNTLSRRIHDHQPTDLGNGKYLVVISKGLPKKNYCFIKVLAKQVYGEYVKVGETGDENEDDL